jgi:hypothetical protein
MFGYNPWYIGAWTPIGRGAKLLRKKSTVKEFLLGSPSNKML